MKIFHDVHTHNIFSNCCTDKGASTVAFLNKEAELGMRTFGLSNHIWDERVKGASYWYRTQTIAKAEEAKNAFSQADPSLKTLFGAETEYYACKDLLGMSEEGASHFDYLLIPHSHLHMRNEVMRDFPEILEARAVIRARLAEQFPYLSESQVNAMAAILKEADILKIFPELEINYKHYINKAMVDGFLSLLENTDFLKVIKNLPVSIAHSFSPCGVPHVQKNAYLELISDSTFENCYRKAAGIGVAIEINVGAVREVNTDLDQNQLIRAYRIAKDVGCSFTFGTDSHSVKGLELIQYGGEIADKLGLVKSDIAEFLQDAVEE